MKAETVVRYNSRNEMRLEVIKLFEKAAALDPHDDLTHYYCARQHAIGKEFLLILKKVFERFVGKNMSIFQTIGNCCIQLLNIKKEDRF